jgi:hypothetical protein
MKPGRKKYSRILCSQKIEATPTEFKKKVEKVKKTLKIDK